MIPFRALNAVLAPGGRQGRLTILIFHRVLRAPDPLLASEPDAATFESHMRDVRGWFNVLPLDDAVARLASASLPPRALSITFDDGYADNFEVALPILRRLGLAATFFVASGFLDGGCMWNDRVIDAVRRTTLPSLDLHGIGLGSVPVDGTAARRSAVDRLLEALKYEAPEVRDDRVARVGDAAQVATPRDLMMTRRQVAGLAEAGMTVGAHTRHHPILARLSGAEARREIAEGRGDLQDITGRPVTLFAYPNGRPGRDYTAEHVQEVRAQGFAAACSTAHGVASARADRYQLPRFTPWARERWKIGAQLARNLRQAEVERV